MSYMKDFALRLEEASNDEIIHIGGKEALEKIEKGVIDLGSETQCIKNHFNKNKGETKNEWIKWISYINHNTRILRH